MITLLLDAALMTLGLASVSLLLGLLLALLMSAAELSRFFWLRWPVTGVTTLIRGLPEILVVLFIYFGSSQVLFLLTGEYVEMSPFWCGVLALSLLFASYATQTLRAALKAVPKGQRQAAEALGLSPLQTFVCIVLPQAWRHALPGLGNQWLVLEGLKADEKVMVDGFQKLPRGKPGDPIVVKPVPWKTPGAAKAPAAAAAPAASAASAAKQ